MISRSPSPLWPLGPLPVVVPALLITAVAFLGTLPMLSWPYQEWVQTSAQFHQQLALAAPIAAAAATYLAGRLTPPHRIFALPTAERAGGAVVTSHLTPLMGSLIIAYLVGLAPLAVSSVRHAQHGAPAMAVVVSGLLALCAAVTVGYLVGVIGRSALLAPLTFVLTLGVTLLGYSGDSYSALTPVLHLDPMLGMRESGPIVAYRIAFFTTVIVIGVLVSAGVLARHRSHTLAPPLRVVALLLVPAMLVAPPLVAKPAVFAWDTNPPRICEVHDGVEYCVHAGHRAQLDQLVQVVGRLLDTYGTATARAASVWDAALRGSTDADNVVVWFQLHPRNPVDTDLVTVAAVLSGLPACLERHGAATPPTAEAREAIEVAEGIQAWLLHGGQPPRGFPLHGVPVAEVQRWIAQHDARIADCTASAEDLP